MAVEISGIWQGLHLREKKKESFGLACIYIQCICEDNDSWREVAGVKKKKKKGRGMRKYRANSKGNIFISMMIIDVDITGGSDVDIK